MINAGEMVPPQLHIVRSANLETLDRDYGMMFDTIIEAYDKHEAKIKEVSSNPDEIGAKVLVVCRGQKDLMGMFELQSLNDYRLTHPEVHFFGLSSDFGIYCDGQKTDIVTNMTKHNLLKKLKALGNNEKAIVFHVDMIGEGIDVPGITGVMPFRNCEMTKLVQNIGRACRLHPNDRLAFYNGEITPSDRTKGWIKRSAWVIIPSYMQDTEGMEWRIKDIADKLRNEFGWVPTDKDVLEVKNGVDDPKNIQTVNDVTKSNRSHKSAIDFFVHEFESLTPVEQLFLVEEMEDREKEYLAEFQKPVLPEPEKTGNMTCNDVPVVLSYPLVDDTATLEISEGSY